jgi:hypothetical protein
MSQKQIVQQFNPTMQHLYAVGDKVRIVNHQFMDGAEGVIAAQMPFTFVAPAYYVKVNGGTFAVSERSLELLKGGDGDGIES